MQNDFRNVLYQKYYSKFKKGSDNLSKKYRHNDKSIEPYIYSFLSALEKNAKIVDLGCGTGEMLKFLWKNGFNNMEGIDLSEEQVKEVVSQGLSARVYDSFEFLEKHINTFDAIIAFDFIEHFTRDEILCLFGLIKNALKEGGILFIKTPNGNSLPPYYMIYGDLTHLTIFNPQSLRQILAFHEFDNIVFKEIAPRPANIKGVIRWLGWNFIKGICIIVSKIECPGETQKIWSKNMICVVRK